MDAERDTFRAACAAAYARRCPPDLRHRLAPRAAQVVARLAARDGVRLSLVTGNLEAVAGLKLERAGLGAFFAARQGGVGSGPDGRAAPPANARPPARGDRRAAPRG